MWQISLRDIEFLDELHPWKNENRDEKLNRKLYETLLCNCIHNCESCHQLRP